MNSISRLVLSAATLALIPMTSAGAADYDPPIFVEEAAEYVPVEIGTGWYLRGDVGYSVFQNSSGPFGVRTYDFATATYTSDTYDSATLTNPFAFGGGFGYRFTDYLRADVTVDVFKSRFSGTTSTAAPCIDPMVAPLLAGTSCSSQDTGEQLGISMLANGYVDLGTVVGITPYVGAGVGATLVKWDDVSRQNYCVGATCPVGFVGTTEHAGMSQLRFTWAAMAGLAYNITDSMKIDLGYRFRRIAGGSMYEWNQTNADAGATGAQATDAPQTHHEVRLGLRYELW